jgi:predicted DNA-binding transcriptional regulator AlpA
MTSKRDQIIRLRTENPILRLTQIADNVGVRKSYVHEVLKKADLPTRSVLIAKKNIPKRIECKSCGEDVLFSATRAERIHHIHESCRYNYHRILVHCKFCRTPFRRRRHRLLSSNSKYIYCSKACLYKARKEEKSYELN